MAHTGNITLTIIRSTYFVNSYKVILVAIFVKFSL